MEKILCFKLLVVLIVSCEQQDLRSATDPSDLEEVPGYLDNTEETLPPDEALTVSLGSSVVHFQSGTVDFQSTVKLKVLKAPTIEMEEGEAQPIGEIIELTIEDDNGDVLRIDEIRKSFNFQQINLDLSPGKDHTLAVLSKTSPDSVPRYFPAQKINANALTLAENYSLSANITANAAKLYFIEFDKKADSITIEQITNDADAQQQAVTPEIKCPDYYVGVPGDSEQGTNDFCVMQYEFSGELGNYEPIKRKALNLRSLSLAALNNVCDSVNAEMISNAHWQTIARNIEGVGSNWSFGYVGGGELNQGLNEHSNYEQIAPADTNDTCYGVDQPNAVDISECNLDQWHVQRRAHYLSTGAIIWDIAGNYPEYVTGVPLKEEKDGYPVADISLYETSLHFEILKNYGPKNEYLSLKTEFPNFGVGNAGGLGSISFAGGAADRILRGRRKFFGEELEYSGIYSVSFEQPGLMHYSTRCVIDPL